MFIYQFDVCFLNVRPDRPVMLVRNTHIMLLQYPPKSPTMRRKPSFTKRCASMLDIILSPQGAPWPHQPQQEAVKRLEFEMQRLELEQQLEDMRERMAREKKTRQQDVAHEQWVTEQKRNLQAIKIEKACVGYRCSSSWPSSYSQGEQRRKMGSSILTSSAWRGVRLGDYCRDRVEVTKYLFSSLEGITYYYGGP